MTKFRAFAIHFGISLLIFIGLAYFVIVIWYPDFFFSSDGGWEGMRIIAGVDLVLGPLLTLIVYKHGKPGLRFDLTAIGVVQTICLVLGTWVVYSERPIVMVYVDGHFYTMNAQAFENNETPIPDLDAFPGPYPKWVQVELPEDPLEAGDIRAELFQASKPMRVATQFYRPFDANEAFLQQHVDIREIEFRDEESKLLAGWLKQHKGKKQDFLFYPFGARYQYIYMGFDTKGELVDVLPVEGPV